MGNEVLIIQHHINARGNFLQLLDFWNGMRKGLLVILEDANGIGWKGFLHSIRSVTGSKAAVLKQANRGEFVDGKIVGRPPLVKGASYALVLRSPEGSPEENSSAAEGKGKALVGDKGCQVTLGEVEGVLWAVRAQLTGVMEYLRDLMIKVDKGLDLVMGLGGGSKMDAPGEGGGRGRSHEFEGLKCASTWHLDVSQIGSLDIGIIVHTDITQDIGRLPSVTSCKWGWYIFSGFTFNCRWGSFQCFE
ncbi:uncharacterized protein LOC121243239 [Juglans microcarpa x Juglans regia]|uniref:uncharacterized protein LOC121243239 n=1 Tax=Juglans microcarpa x Juglans regia TaxID=2249226 RepID=UPI001B7E4A15|nr:uncharacterized protein LOC121243239 [Juglans microcarpa x Juglans regia]